MIDDIGTTTHAWAMTREQGWRRLEVMLDVQTIVLCLQYDTSLILESRTIDEDISILVLMFEECRFGFEHRKFNRTCACLADYAISHDISYDVIYFLFG